jgi:hypothetical protein
LVRPATQGGAQAFGLPSALGFTLGALRASGYSDIREARDFNAHLDYIHLNPVRPGFVNRPEDWPQASARAWSTGVDEPLRIDRD